MKFKIVVYYTTGDSFSSEQTSEVVLDGLSEDIAKQNLKRIEEHYRWYKYADRQFEKDPVPRPKWHDQEYEASIQLIAANGVPYWTSASWCGYFETLHWAEVQVDTERVDFGRTNF